MPTSPNPDDPLAALNDAQRQAVEHGVKDGDTRPLLIVAGAGSGKTNTLAHRVAHLIRHGADPARILLLTFSRRAAQEMERRAETVLAGVQRGVVSLPWSGTFHSIGARLLREYAPRIGLDEAFTIHDRGDAEDLMGMVRHELGLDSTEQRFPKKGTCLSIYSRTVNGQEPVDEVLAQDGTFAPAPVGLTLTTRQILDLTLVPSANNYAISYARWVFGSDEAFLAAAHDWLARNGLATVHIQEAAGLSDNNVASTADIVRLARIALSNPLVAEIVSQSQIEIAGLGEITTTNRLLGDPGVVGVKTGTTFPEGYSLVAAKHEIFGERDLIAIAVTMDRPDGDARAGDTRAALAAMATTGQQVQLAEQGARIGTAVTWTGAKVPLLVAADLATVLVPPETASRSIELSQVAIGPKGTKVGEIQATMPTGEQTIEIITGAKIEEPGFGGRFTHPGELLGL